MRLSVHMSRLCLEQGPLLRVMRAVLKSRWPMTLMGLCCVLEAAHALLQSTARAAMPAVSILSDLYSAYSCAAAARQPRFWRILREMKSLVQAMEATPGEKVWADSTRSKIAVITIVFLGNGAFVLLSMLADMLLSDKPMVTLWPFVPHAASWGVLVGRLFWGTAATVCMASLCHVFVTLICVTIAATGMHLALEERLLDSTRLTPEVVEDVIRLHQQLRHETLDLVDFFATNLVHILASSFVNTFLSVVELLINDVTNTTYVLLLPVVVIFLQLSYFSQELSDSSLALKRSAFAAATSGAVDLSEARALQLVMLTASRPPALGCRGLGRLSLANAGQALRQAYSLVNVLSSKL